MKNVLTIVCLLILGTVTSLNGHGLAAHMAIYDKVIEYYYCAASDQFGSFDLNK